MPPTGSRPPFAGHASSWLAYLSAACLAALLWFPGSCRAGGLRLEFGPAYEYTNLIYRSHDLLVLGSVCDSVLHPGGCADSELIVLYQDTLVISRSPEASLGGFARFTISDTTAPGRLWWLEPELRLAPLLVTAHVYGTARWTAGRPWVLGLDQRFDHSADQRFDLSRRLDTEVLTGLAGWRSEDLAWSVDFRPRMKLEYANGSLTSYLQSSNSGRASVSVSHFGDGGSSQGLDAYAGSRAYPDSGRRDYQEYFGSGRMDQRLIGPVRGAASVEWEQRTGPEESTRSDLFTRRRAEGELDWLADSWKARAIGQAERYDYRNPDEVFFDTRLYRGEWTFAKDLSPGLGVEVRPKWESLRAPAVDEEEYNQVSVALGATRVGDGLLDLLLEAGRRHYLIDPDAVADSIGSVGTHSDYHFYSISALLSQPVGEHFKLKGTLDFQTEVHDNPGDDNHIVFLSAELGYSFGLLGR